MESKFTFSLFIFTSISNHKTIYLIVHLVYHLTYSYVNQEI